MRTWCYAPPPAHRAPAASLRCRGLRRPHKATLQSAGVRPGLHALAMKAGCRERLSVRQTARLSLEGTWEQDFEGPSTSERMPARVRVLG